MTAPPVPYTFINGTPADATQVNANFTAVINDLNNIDGGQITTGTLAAGRVSATLITTGTLPYARFPTFAATKVTPGNPAGTASPSLVMMGLGSTATITPSASGKVVFSVFGNATNSNAGAYAQVQLNYGTGAAPANGVAQTGTIATSAPAIYAPANSALGAFCLNVSITGLTVGVAYWYDLALLAFIAGTASVSNLTMSAHEIP
jgi:hypothetical protein